MDISYIKIKKSYIDKDYSVRDGSIISGLIYQPHLNLVRMSNLEKLAIYLEQYILSDYLLQATPNNKDLQKYKSKVLQSFIFKKNEILKDSKSRDQLLKDEYFSEINLNTLLKYMNGEQVSPLLVVKLCQDLEKCKFDRCSFLDNFYTPYLSQGIYAKNIKDEYPYYNNPVILTPKQSFKKPILDDFNRSPIILHTTSYTRNTYRPISIDKDINNNKFYSYYINMDFNNKSWQSIVDTLQKFNLSSSTESLSNLSGLLNNYIFNKYIPGMIDRSKSRRIFLSIFNYIDKYNKLSITNSNPRELARLMSVVFTDDRCYYLLNENPERIAIELWNTYNDLACFTKYAVEAAETDADDASETESTDDSGDGADSSDSDATDTDTTDDETTEDVDDSEGGDEGGDDDFDFGDGGEGGDDSSDSSSDGGDEEEADPEDVNPLIQIIENESFDEYLERGIIEKKLLAIFKNPPIKLTANQINTMKFWYIQWFPLVSVETTKKILGELLEVEIPKDEE